MTPAEYPTVEKQVVTRYVVDCPRCPYHEVFSGPVMAHYARSQHERSHIDADRT